MVSQPSFADIYISHFVFPDHGTALRPCIWSIHVWIFHLDLLNPSIQVYYSRELPQIAAHVVSSNSFALLGAIYVSQVLHLQSPVSCSVVMGLRHLVHPSAVVILSGGAPTRAIRFLTHEGVLPAAVCPISGAV